MLTAAPKHLLSRTYVVYDGDERIGEMSQALWTTRGEVALGRQRLDLWKRGLGWETFVLEQDGAVVAEADKPAMRQRFTLRFAGATCEMRRRGLVNRAFDVTCGGRTVGSVEQVGILGRKAQIDLPEDWPIGLQVFVFWLAAVSWRRQAAAAGA